ncbi:hypothetical protein AB4Y32_21995 [Paraburkholderia phymatum]|uniref:Uncharacterized protein n=1 Tax=Paraburkholderia phymatum TaxID=148447 RepID=A0ACC6U4E7_9BURK
MKKYGLLEFMILRFIEVAIDQRYQLAAHDPLHAPAQLPCVALSFHHSAGKRAQRAHQIAIRRDALQLAVSDGGKAMKPPPGTRGGRAPKSAGTYLIALRQKTRYAAAKNAISRTPHIRAMLTRTEVTKISVS